jgi:hypothetical protein
MFGKRVWEYIDINERINFPLYYPIKKTLIDRKPLFNILREYVQTGVKNNAKIKDFCFEDDYFSIPLDNSTAESKFYDFMLTKDGDINVNKNFNPNKIDPAVDAPGFRDLCLNLINTKKIKEGPDYKTAELNASNVVGYKIQGYWYFNKRLAELKYRLIAIAPIATSANSILVSTKGQQEIEDEFTELEQTQGFPLNAQQLDDKSARIKKYEEMSAPNVLFWIYYPAIRSILKENPTFNDRNSSKPINFDDLLISRHFNSVIYLEENVQGDRSIVDYKPNDAMDQLLESERVKEKIRDYEHDMWNY